MTPLGHEEPFRPTSLNGRYRLDKATFAGMRRNGRDAPIPDLRLWRHTPRGLARGASNFDLPAQLHDPVRGNAEELGRIQGEVAQEDKQPIPPCQKNE
jgi:hypothetical protein